MRRGSIAGMLFGVLLLVVVVSIDLPRGAGGVKHMNVPGRDDDRPFANLVVAGDTVYLAGALGLDPDTRKVPDDVATEVRNIMENMQQRLEMVDMTMDDLVSVQVFCSDVSLYGEFNEVYRTYFEERFPARAFIGSGPLLFGARFEIMGTAVRH